ncbi:MAG TPA: hypothetical protein VNQ79_16180 [Blastocatellia bacterium]|nr:hypothetical protein [Blastocatellia bacterium]
MKSKNRLVQSLIPAAVLATVCCFAAAAQTVTTVNAASFSPDQTVGAGSIAAAFGTFKTQDDTKVFTAPGLPLPKTLGGVKVTVNGVDAELFFVSKNQINYVIPAGTPVQTVQVIVTNSDNTTVSGTVKVAAAAPGIFSAKATGSGAAAALTTTDGVTYKTVFDSNGNEVDVDAGTSNGPTNILVLYGTSIRNAPAASPSDGNGVAESVKVTIQGVPCAIDYAGPAPGYVGLDQINVRLSPEMAGLGSVTIKVSITSIDTDPDPAKVANPTSNTVTIKIGGSLPPIQTTRINAGDTINGALTINDQIEKDANTGATYFFDAYRFTGSANQTLAIDLRSAQFDATIILYRLGGDGSINYLASDDISGGYSNGQKVNNNAMLLTVLPENSDYLIFATTADSDPDGLGNYSIKLLSNVITPIAYGASLTNAAITTSDIQISTGDYWDAYWFQGTQGDKIQIDLTSAAFNSYLILNRNSGDFVIDDDNSGGGNNARIAPPKLPSLPATDKYIIVATPYAPNVTGAYTLSLVKLTGLTGDAAQAAESSAAPAQVPGRSGLIEFYQQHGLNSERFAARRVIR